MAFGSKKKYVLPVILIMIASFAVKTSRSSPLENDENFMFLRVQVHGMQSKMDQLINQLAEEKTLRQQLQTKNSELETQIVKQNERLDLLKTEFQDQIHQLKIQSEKQEEEIRLLNQRNDDNIAAFEFSENKNTNQINENGFKSDLSPRLPPSSCRQLSTIGHNLDGIYLVANPETNKIEAVYCDFGSSTLSETLFGSVDVKSKLVHFFVQRSSDFSLANVVIPFDLERLNVGGAMNLATGVFTAPVDGIYHFEFFGLRDLTDSNAIGVGLNVNGVRTGTCHGDDLPNYFVGLSGISASLRLKVGDQVTLIKGSGTLNDDIGHYTHFTGWLVEEDLVLD